jgi:hypothetical protein
MPRTNSASRGAMVGATVGRRVYPGLLCGLLALGVLRAAQLPPATSQAHTTSAASASSGRPALDGRWWGTISAAEQSGYVNGYEDCYNYDVKGVHTATGWTVSKYAQAVDVYYREHRDQLSNPVGGVLKQLNRTGKPRPTPKGGEEWKELHGYYDGLWWRGSSPTEQLGYVEGYLSCYSTELAGRAETFSKSAHEYVGLLNAYMKAHLHSDEEKVANILSRFSDRQSAQ